VVPTRRPKTTRGLATGDTCQARVILYGVQTAEKLGVAPGRLLKRLNLTDADLEDPDARVPHSVVTELWRLMIEETRDPFLGVRVGMLVPVRSLGLVGYTMLYSDTLGHAINKLVRYGKIVNESLQVSVVPESRGVRVVIAPAAELHPLKHPVIARLTGLLCACRELTQVDVIPRETWFPHAEPEDTTLHREIFRSPLKFNRREGTLRLTDADLALPIETGDEALLGYLDRLADETLRDIPTQHSFVEQVRRAIWRELSGGRPTVSVVAPSLAVSARTLQRRLSEQDTTFAAVLDDLRRELAAGLLRDDSHSIHEIAFLLGYVESSTFYRAHRRWTGLSPREYRTRAD
jgi:AraC-like DNA-binding protein